MAGAILNSGHTSSHRRRTIAFVVLSLIAITLAATLRHHLGRPRLLASSPSYADAGYSKPVKIKEFVKPKGVTVIGFVFFGRKSRVEMLRCYIEVSANTPQH
jgi:hypothetical protein